MIARRRNSRITVTILFIFLSVMMTVSIPTTSAANNYNRSAAVSYADLWSNNCGTMPHSQCPWRRNSSQYVSFGSNDCANFISQVMRGGSLSQVTSALHNGIPDPNSSQNWFYNYPGIGTTKSWRLVVDIRNHAYSSLGNRFDAVPYFYQIGAGGFFVFDNSYPYNSGDPTHGRVIIGNGNDLENGQFGQLASSHTAERKRILYNKYWNPNTQTTWKIHVRN